MRFIHNTSTDPAFNLAAEECLLRSTAGDVFMLWRNAPAVIVGRNQNTLAEIDEEFLRKRGIPVIRRLTGGGAVFHDLGNVNFTFISLDRRGEGLDFRRFTEPVLDALRDMGVPCSFEGRNDLAIEGKKFSGNAQHVSKDRVLHHGTLLFAAEMANLSGALRVNPAKYQDKAVQSIRKRVTNISSHLPQPMPVEAFMVRLMAHVSGGAAGDDLALTEAERREIARLAEEKYRTWEWNFGFSPRYTFSRSTRTPGGVLDARLDVAEGVILAARLYGDYFGVRDVAGLEALLVGCRHQREQLAERLGDVPLGEYIQGVNLPVFLDCLF
ncbi:MAG: lipoate--protein ligase [Desulfovibrionaceae bacterium CG1_02_65_16]|nr:MAG: lipoate--protein ligase [Desulfovibrionaceae bacterium CG1_02_65_16]